VFTLRGYLRIAVVFQPRLLRIVETPSVPAQTVPRRISSVIPQPSGAGHRTFRAKKRIKALSKGGWWWSFERHPSKETIVFWVAGWVRLFREKPRRIFLTKTTAKRLPRKAGETINLSDLLGTARVRGIRLPFAHVTRKRLPGLAAFGRFKSRAP